MYACVLGTTYLVWKENTRAFCCVKLHRERERDRERTAAAAAAAEMTIVKTKSWSDESSSRPEKPPSWLQRTWDDWSSSSIGRTSLFYLTHTFSISSSVRKSLCVYVYITAVAIPLTEITRILWQD